MEQAPLSPALRTRAFMQRVIEAAEAIGEQILAEPRTTPEDRMRFCREVCLVTRAMRLASSAWAAGYVNEATMVRALKSKARAEAEVSPLDRRAGRATQALGRLLEMRGHPPFQDGEDSLPAAEDHAAPAPQPPVAAAPAAKAQDALPGLSGRATPSCSPVAAVWTSPSPAGRGLAETVIAAATSKMLKPGQSRRPALPPPKRKKRR